MTSYNYYSHEYQLVRDIIKCKKAYFKSVQSREKEFIWYTYNEWMTCKREYKEIFNHDFSPEDCEHCKKMMEDSRNKPNDGKVAGVIELGADNPVENPLPNLDELYSLIED